MFKVQINFLSREMK